MEFQMDTMVKIMLEQRIEEMKEEVMKICKGRTL
jgi:hypothetical protein